MARELLRRCLQEAARPPEVLNRAPSHINVGSDCAGYGSDLLALNRPAMRPWLQAKLTFYSDIDAKKRDLLELTHAFCGLAPPAKRFKYSDVAERDNAEAPACDLYVAGPPCPAFSTAGLRRGIEDPRGAVTFHCLDYVRAQRPRAVVIENVKGMASPKHKRTLDWIVKTLRALQYEVHIRVLNAADYGVPQHRERLFVVGIRDKKRTFKWPKKFPLPQSALRQFLKDDGCGNNGCAPRPVPVPEKLHTLAAKVPGGLRQLKRDWYVVDLASSPAWSSVRKPGVCPTLTRARCGHKAAYFVPLLGRFLQVEDMAALQGLDLTLAKNMVKKVGRRPVAQAIGDAMQVDVLARLLARVLWSAGLTDKQPDFDV